MANQIPETGQAVIDIFNQIIARIKSFQPVRTDGKGLTTGFVYSQLVSGMPCDPADYMNPWSPVGGGTIQDAVTSGQLPAAGAPTTGYTPAQLASMNAAWKTSSLINQMIMVTKDNSCMEYPTPRQISVNYGNIINSMQSAPLPPISPDVQKQIDAANKVLFKTDANGNVMIGVKNDQYKAYSENARAYALAQVQFQTDSKDPSKQAMLTLDKQAVDDAYNTWIAGGAQQIEQALDVLGSIGVSMQDNTIKNARQMFKDWSGLQIPGIPDAVPYSYVSPSDWADPASDDSGWTHLHSERSTYQSVSTSQAQSTFNSMYKADSSSSSGGGGISIFGFGGAGGGGSSNSSWSNTIQGQGSNKYTFKNDATNLSIDLEYAVCTIFRPWFLGDLFYLPGWYSKGSPKNTISDGTVNGQVDNITQMLPMVPMQFLVVRNVTIKASNWGSDSSTWTQIYNDMKAAGSASSWNAEGGGGFSLGFLTIGGEGSHSESHSQNTFSAVSSSDSSQQSGWYFDGSSLVIKGAQIVAWLSTITPASAPLDDPTLSQAKSS